VQEAVLLEADVHEGGLEAGEDVVHAALVDVSDDRARAAALEVQLCDPEPRTGVGLLAALAHGGLCRRLAGRFEQRNARLRAVNADQYLLFHVSFLPLQVERSALEGGCHSGLAIH
jgi:hypothetical protein